MATGSLDQIGTRSYENLDITEISMTNVDSSPKAIWIPADDYRVRIHTVVLMLQNRTANSWQKVIIEVREGQAWKALLPVGVRGLDYQTVTLNLYGNLRTDRGNGTTARIRLVEAGGSSDWTAQAIIVGKEVKRQ